MIRPTCETCNREMRCLKNEVALVHYINNEKANGIDAVRFGDLWGCEHCGCRVVIGLAQEQIEYPDIPEGFEAVYGNRMIEVKR